MKASKFVACLAACSMVSSASAGVIKGTIVLKGDVPEPTVAVKMGDTTVKDANICAAKTLISEELVIDKESKGIANVFIYMPKAPSGVKFGASETKKLILDQKNCRFVPHAMIVRTDQEVEVISSDGCAHNFHTYPIKNDPLNVLMGPNTPEGKGVKLEFAGPEILPIKVGCDIHSWMEAYWMVIDHPFAAVTNEKGEFEIQGLPDGEHTFRVWQKKAGYLEKSLKIKVKGDSEVKYEYTLKDFE